MKSEAESPSSGFKDIALVGAQLVTNISKNTSSQNHYPTMSFVQQAIFRKNEPAYYCANARKYGVESVTLKKTKEGL